MGEWIVMMIVSSTTGSSPYQKASIEATGQQVRPRRERSITRCGPDRREALILGLGCPLSGALGETQAASVFKGHFFPVDLQENVRPGLFGSGCQ